MAKPPTISHQRLVMPLPQNGIKKEVQTPPSVSITTLYAEAAGQHVAGNMAKAAALYQQVLQMDSQHADSIHMLGAISLQQGDTNSAIALIEQSIAINKQQILAYSNLITAHMQRGKLADALQVCQTAQSYFSDISLRYSEAKILARLGNTDLALALLQSSVTDSNVSNEAFSIAMHLQPNQPLAAALFYQRCLHTNPSHPHAANNLGACYAMAKDHAKAVAVYRQAITITPDNPVLYNNLGLSLAANHAHADALLAFEQAVLLQADYTDAHVNLANSQAALGHTDTATQRLQQLQQQNPNHAGIATALANIYLAEHQPDLAEHCLRQTLARDCNNIHALNSMGAALAAQRQYAQALDFYDRVCLVKPEFFSAHTNRGNALFNLGQFEASILAYRRAEEIDPGNLENLMNMANVFIHSKQPAQAIAVLEQIQALPNKSPMSLGLLMHQYMHICQWGHFDTLYQQISTAIVNGQSVISPFALQSLCDDPALLAKATKIFEQEQHQHIATTPMAVKRKDTIHIAYLSVDYGNHPVSLLIQDIIKLHDRSRFTVSALVLNDVDAKKPPSILAHFDHIHPLHALSDQEAVAHCRQLELDMVIDLGGYTQNHRSQLLAHRIAPLQIGYIGFLGSMHAQFMDGLISDRILTPPELAHHYSEKLIMLPTYQANSNNRQMATPATKAQFNIRPEQIVFACFNQNFKITPQVFASWMTILRAAPDSALMLYIDSPLGQKNLLAEAAEAGVNPERIVFAPRVDYAAYLARYAVVDVFLDTHPYNAGTTASDALWAGVPVLTRIGNTMSARMAASLLDALGMQELITHSINDYEQLAIKLATNPPLLAEMKQKLHMQKTHCDLFKPEKFTISLEHALCNAIASRASANG